MNKAQRFAHLTCTEAIRSDLRGRSVRAAAITGLSSGGDFLIRIGSTAVLARLLLPEAFGLVMMVMAVTAIAEQLRELGLSAATIQRKEITHEQVSNLFWINAGIGTLLTILVCALSPLIATYYREPRLTALTCALASNFTFGGLMVQHQALLTRQLKLGHTSAVRLVSSLLSTMIAIILAWTGCGVWALVWREVSRGIILTIGMWLYCPWIPGWPSRNTNIGAMLGFGTNLTASNVLGSIASGCDRFLLGRFWGAAPVAIYRQAYQLMIAPTDQLVSPLYNVAQPALSMLQNDPTRFATYYKKVLTIVCMVTMPLSLFVCVYSHEIAYVVLGPQWTDCGTILLILSLGTFIRQPAGSTAFVILARGNSRTYLRFTILHNIVFVALVFVGARWGTIGVAISDVATIWLMAWPRLHYSLLNSPVTIKAFLTTATRPASASIIMALLIALIRGGLTGVSPTLSLTLGSIAAPALFLTALFVLPGGRASVTQLITDLRIALQRRKTVSKPASPVAEPA